VSSAIHRRLYRVATEWLPAHTAEIELLARLWQRESLLLPVALYVDAEDSASLSAEMSVALRRFLSRDLGVIFVGVSENPLNLSGPTFSIDVTKPSPAEQRDAWSKFFSESEPEAEADQMARLLAGQFNLSFSDIRQATLMTAAAPEEVTPSERVWEVCRNLTRPEMDSLAQRLEPKATWDDLILPVEQMSLMRQIAAQVRERHKVYEAWGFARVMNRGFGISALFAGESGTGKTMAAEVIANELKLNLYRIDLSAVVSKYIGETEKNLRKLFDAVERGGSILFFDEADALFGKRSEVKDSHDRYANIEINYLLQRMEAFSGLAILATNMKTALDSAFMRRLRFIVNFPFPGVRERMAIWQKALPAETPKKDLDYERLARLNLSGGNIHSIALNAAFIAAQNGQTVTMPILLTAARIEMRKLEKAFSEAEFR
jgi:SpoVK/Ycf46/Vps4 family AAA+-type ATPase